MFNPMLAMGEDDDEQDEQMLLPNTPRDPDREAMEHAKVKSYLQGRMRPDRSSVEPLSDNNRDLAFTKFLMDSANQIGTVGGRTASSKPLGDLTQNLMAQNQATGQRFEADRKDAAADEDRQAKLMQYFAQKKAADERFSYQQKRDQENALRQEENAKRQQQNADRSYGMQAERLKMDRESLQKASPETKLNQQFAKGNSEFNSYMDNALTKIDSIRKQIGKTGTFEMFGNADNKLNQDMYDLAVNYAKIVDPESVAREGEVAAAKKYMLEVQGLFTRNQTALDSIEGYRKALMDRVASRQRSTPGYKPTPYIEQMGQQNPSPEAGTAQAAPAAKPKKDVNEMSEQELLEELNGGG